MHMHYSRYQAVFLPPGYKVNMRNATLYQVQPCNIMVTIVLGNILVLSKYQYQNRYRYHTIDIIIIVNISIPKYCSATSHTQSVRLGP